MNRYIHHYLDGLGSSLFSRVPLPIQLPHLWRSFGAPTYRGSNTGKKDTQKNIIKPNWVPKKIYIYKKLIWTRTPVKNSSTHFHMSYG